MGARLQDVQRSGAQRVLPRSPGDRAPQGLSARLLRRLVFGHVALVVHTISAGEPAFGTSEIAEIQSAGRNSCVLSKKGALACAQWKPRLMKVQPLASMAVRADRATCGAWTVDDVKSIAAGDGFACAVKKNGEVECSGGPIKTETLRDVDEIAAGDTHVCVRQRGTVRCGGWGSQVGIGDLDVSHPDPMAVALPARATSIHATPTTSCATLEDGSIYCWGRTGFVHDAEWCGFLQTELCTTRPSRVTFD